MLRRSLCAFALLAASFALGTSPLQAEQRAFGRVWGGIYGKQDWQRFYHYPYVFYPQNYWGQEYYKSSESLYYRYPNEMRIPVYNKKWYNPYPSCHPYYQGAHFILDVF
ncbi:MAG TPA: calmodulin-binding protein [Pirellulaceae bacterium]